MLCPSKQERLCLKLGYCWDHCWLLQEPGRIQSFLQQPRSQPWLQWRWFSPSPQTRSDSPTQLLLTVTGRLWEILRYLLWCWQSSGMDDQEQQKFDLRTWSRTWLLPPTCVHRLGMWRDHGSKLQTWDNWNQISFQPITIKTRLNFTDDYSDSHTTTLLYCIHQP